MIETGKSGSASIDGGAGDKHNCIVMDRGVFVVERARQ
jgi:hypothetical protein